MSADASAEVAAAGPVAIDEAHLMRSVVRLAWPVVIQQVSFTMVQLVDTFLVGHLGEDALAGVGLATLIYWFPISGMFAIGIGATAVVARNIGAGQPERAEAALRSALLLGVGWGIATGIVFFAAAAPLLNVMGAEPQALDKGVLYMQAAAFGLPFYTALYIGNACLQGAGNTRTPMIIMLLVNLVNGVVAYLLINGPGPFPDYGVRGSGLGYTAAALAGTVLVMFFLVRGRSGLQYLPHKALLPDRDETARIMRVGIPAGAEQFQFQFAFMAYTRIISSLGTTALAAHQVALRIEGLTFQPGFALGVAATTLVGQSLGAQRPDLAQKVALTAVRIAFFGMTAAGIALMVFGGQITQLFIAEPDVVDTGRRLLLIFGFALPALAVALALGGALRGAGDTRSVLVIMTAGVWGVRLLPAYLLAVVAGLGVPGAWVAAVVDINFRALLMFARFRQGKWKTIKV
ncbi:MAG: MATE family efflux transporter [Chloroflexi bacterium]|nr:MATE family efflux transporter [Chloroflexota bacterium]